MHIQSTVIPGTIQKGELQTENALSLFPDGTSVYVISREDFNRIAGSDSARHQLEQKTVEVDQIKRALEAVNRESLTLETKAEVEEVLGVSK